MDRLKQEMIKQAAKMDRLSFSEVSIIMRQIAERQRLEKMSDECDGPENLVFHEDFGDPEVMLNSRDWLQAALESKGAIWLGGGIGMGEADIDIELEGMEYNVKIRPILTPQGGKD